jgi:hypothetical protein
VSLTEQPTIFDAIRERDEAIASIDANTVETFKQCARQAILNVGRMRPHFTSDHVWDWLETHDSVQAHDNRALRCSDVKTTQRQTDQTYWRLCTVKTQAHVTY